MMYSPGFLISYTPEVKTMATGWFMLLAMEKWCSVKEGPHNKPTDCFMDLFF